MTAFPAIPRQPLLTEGVPSRQTVSRRDAPALREFPSVKETDTRPGEQLQPKEPSKNDEGGSSFRRIFLEKKAERESAEPSKAPTHEAGAHGKEKIPATADTARRAVKEAARRSAVAKETKKPSTWKDILAGLVDENAKTGKPERKEKAEAKKTDRKAEMPTGGRALSPRERLENAKQKTDGLSAMKRALSRAGAEKPLRQLVIIDLRVGDRRDRAAEKTKPADGLPKVKDKQPVGKTESREPRRPADAKDAFETKVFYKPGALPERQEAGIRPAAEEAARARSDFSARLAEVMKNEMVRHTGLVLKNGGNGEIHLVLKPESLGSVRIRLNLEDNHIVGKIIVDNNTVKRIMEENLGHLETALQQNGYEAAAFDVSVAGERRREAGVTDFAGRADAERARDTAPAGEYEAAGASIYADSLVNIVL